MVEHMPHLRPGAETVVTRRVSQKVFGNLSPPFLRRMLGAYMLMRY